MFCKFCGSELVDDAIFCSNCGEKISKNLPPKFCVWCGAELDDDSVFCFNCGKNIKLEYEAKTNSPSRYKEQLDVNKKTETLNKETVSSRRETQKEKKEFTWGHFILVMLGILILPWLIFWLIEEGL